MCFLWETEKERGIATAEVEGAVLRAKGGSECTLSISNNGVRTGTHCWGGGLKGDWEIQILGAVVLLMSFHSITL